MLVDIYIHSIVYPHPPSLYSFAFFAFKYTIVTFATPALINLYYNAPIIHVVLDPFNVCVEKKQHALISYIYQSHHEM